MKLGVHELPSKELSKGNSSLLFLLPCFKTKLPSSHPVPLYSLPRFGVEDGALQSRRLTAGLYSPFLLQDTLHCFLQCGQYSDLHEISSQSTSWR